MTIGVLVIAFAAAAVPSGSAEDPADPRIADLEHRLAQEQAARVSAEKEATRMRQLAYKRRQRILGLEATLRHKPAVSEAINLACTTFKVSCSRLWRVARCESGSPNPSPNAKNPSSSASGLFQFLYPSTWRRTPFSGFSVWSPHANALAAAWMFANGRSGEWACR